MPDTRSVVIKNGIDYEELKIKKDFTYKDPLRLVYFSTPWRGLDVLLNTMELLKDEKDIVLDVYSSTIIYGDGFHIENEPKFLKLYEQARDLKNVNYKGYLHHNELMEKLKEYHVSVHPSTFEETFCISAMGALAAGCMLITTDLGAIPETCAEFPVYIPYTADKKHLAAQTAASIKQAREILSARDISQSLKFQQQYYKYYYDWKVIGPFWDRFLQGTIHARRKEKNLQT